MRNSSLLLSPYEIVNSSPGFNFVLRLHTSPTDLLSPPCKHFSVHAHTFSKEKSFLKCPFPEVKKLWVWAVFWLQIFWTTAMEKLARRKKDQIAREVSDLSAMGLTFGSLTILQFRHIYIGFAESRKAEGNSFLRSKFYKYVLAKRLENFSFQGSRSFTERPLRLYITTQVKTNLFLSFKMKKICLPLVTQNSTLTIDRQDFHCDCKNQFQVWLLLLVLSLCFLHLHSLIGNLFE